MSTTTTADSRQHYGLFFIGVKTASGMIGDATLFLVVWFRLMSSLNDFMWTTCPYVRTVLEYHKTRVVLEYVLLLSCID